MAELPIEPARPDLSLALDVAEVPAELRGHVFERTLIEKIDLSRSEAMRLQVVESRLSHVDLGDGLLRDSQFRDVVAADGSWANMSAEGSKLRRAELQRLRMTGVNLSGSEIEDCVFLDCRVDLASFRFAKLDRVRFERCRMEEADFYDAKLTSVVFDECNLTGAVWAQATFLRSEMRGCDITGAVNPERLRGVRMPWRDVIGAAAELAAAVGVEIID